MAIHHNNDHFPVLGLHEFRNGQFAGSDNLLFNELHGERHIDKPHQHDFFIILLFDQANGVHNIDFRDHSIGSQQVHLLFPGQVHKWNIGAETTGYQLMIGRDYFERLSPSLRFSIANYQNHPVIQLSVDSFKLLHYEFDAIKDELANDDSLPELIGSRIAVIASIVSKEADKVFKDGNLYQSEPRVIIFQQMIDVYFKEQKRVSFYAKKLHISANYLNILCKKYVKISATQLIQQRIILEAKRLLMATTLSVKEIAFELNFADQAYFSNFFKAQTGETPTEYRDAL